MYTAEGGGRGYFLNGPNFLRCPPYHAEFFHNPHSWPKEKIAPPPSLPPPPSLDKDRRGYKGTRTLLFWGPKFHLKALQQLRELTIFSGDTLEHVDCAIHYLEKQSVVDVDDVK